MSFLTPAALIFAALGIPILILYMLKLRRRDVLVSSTLLWQRLLRDREANAPWQRLRRNLLLLLQLLILALLILALARPFVPTQTVVSGSVIVLLDGSASMQARDVADGATTRFDAAVRAAEEIVAGLNATDVATLIAVGPQPRVLASATGDRALLRRALEDATPTAGSADWEAAFALASAGLMGAEDVRVVLISDGALPENLPSLPGEVRFVGVGGGGANLAIAALATREGASGPQAFLRIANYGNTDAETLVEFSADGVLFDARRLRVPAHSSTDLTLTDLPYDLQILQARLAVEDVPSLDALSLDSIAWTVHTPPASGRVLLVSEGNLFLERALGALPGVELTRLSPDQVLPSEPYELYVYDRDVYDRVVTGTLPAGNLCLIGPVPSVDDGFLIEVGGVFTATAIVNVAADDPILRYVDWSNVHVLQARAVELPPGARVLVEAQGGPLLFVVEQPGGASAGSGRGRLAVLTFDLHDSDLPLQIAFPILIANLTDWLLPRGAARFSDVIHPGDPVVIQTDPEATEVRIVTPDGVQHTLLVGQAPLTFAATDQLGIYRVGQVNRSGDVLQSAGFAVNLFDEAESNIVPREVVRIGQAEVSAAAREEAGRREFWPWLAGAALGVLAAEWWAYHLGTGRQGDKKIKLWGRR